MIGGKLKSNLLRLWWGEVSLARAFCGYLIGGFILVLFTGIFLIALIYLFAHWFGLGPPSPITGPLSGLWGLLALAYLGFGFVGVWQTSSRYISSRPYPSAPFLAVLTKVLLIVWGGYILFNLWRNLPWLLLRVMG